MGGGLTSSVLASGSSIDLVRPQRRGRVATSILTFGGCKSPVAFDACLSRLQVGCVHHPMITFAVGRLPIAQFSTAAIFRLSGHEVRQEV